MLKAIKLLFIIFLIAGFGLACVLLPYIIVNNYNVASLLAVMGFLGYCGMLDLLISKGVL